MKLNSGKRARTSDLIDKVAKLERSVARNKPELRQVSYELANGLTGSTPVPLIELPSDVIGDEVKLHRIMICWRTTVAADDLQTSSAGVHVYWTIHSPRQGFDPSDGFQSTTAGALENYLCYPDNTKQRVWLRNHANLNSIVDPPSGASNFKQTGNIYCLDKKFPMPMRIGFDTGATPTIKLNQIYFSGNSGEYTNATACVTLWYTDN